MAVRGRGGQLMARPASSWPRAGHPVADLKNSNQAQKRAWFCSRTATCPDSEQQSSTRRSSSARAARLRARVWLTVGSGAWRVVCEPEASRGVQCQQIVNQ